MKRQVVICLFYYGGTMYWIEFFLAFTAGVLATKLLGGFLSFGFSVLVLKEARNGFLRVAGHVSEILYEVQQLRVMEMHKMKRSEKEIEISTSISEHNLRTLREMLIRGFISAFPKKYDDLVGFSDWDSAMLCLEELVKEERAKNFKQ
tara:strand:- start:14 stop:457 length:444 start_codon:yes stop_codon:yes gene_type:complete